MANFEDREARRKSAAAGSLDDTSFDAGGVSGLPKEHREAKKRISLSVRPSLYADIQKIAYMQRISVSSLVGTQLELYREQYKDELTRYQTLEFLETGEGIF